MSASLPWAVFVNLIQQHILRQQYRSAIQSGRTCAPVAGTPIVEGQHAGLACTILQRLINAVIAHEQDFRLPADATSQIGFEVLDPALHPEFEAQRHWPMCLFLEEEPACCKVQVGRAPAQRQSLFSQHALEMKEVIASAAGRLRQNNDMRPCISDATRLRPSSAPTLVGTVTDSLPL